MEGDGLALDFYRYRKLMDRYCEVVAIKNDMTLEEVLVLLYLKQGLSVQDTAQLAELTGLTKRNAGSAMQKLEKKQMVKKESVKRKKRYVLCPEAAPILHDLEQAEKDFEEVRFREFSEEEKRLYSSLAEKLHGNVKNILRS